MKEIIKGAFLHSRNIGKIWSSLSVTDAETQIHAFVVKFCFQVCHVLLQEVFRWFKKLQLDL